MTPLQKPTHHNIELFLKGEDAVPGTVPELVMGDTVRYFSNDGEASVSFPDKSPFRQQIVSDRETVVVSNSGDFRCRCFITKNDEKFGWKDDSSPSGADHHVKQP